MTRTDARELLMQGVFQMDIQKESSNNLLELLIADKKIDKENREYIIKSFEVIKNNIITIDQIIDKFSNSWKINRMPKVDLAILRVGVSELMYQESIPNAVVINEAVEMAKKYCTEESKKFINGLLGSIERETNV